MQIWTKINAYETRLLIDMDGVIYSVELLIEGADRFINNLIKKDTPFIFMTNNSQRTRIEVVRKLKHLGIEVTVDHVYTSAMATGKFLGDQGSHGTVYVLGEGRNFTLEMVQRAVDMILAGAKFITTNRDPSPKKPGLNNLGIGATTEMIEEATGRNAFVTGKPILVMMRSARKYLG